MLRYCAAVSQYEQEVSAHRRELRKCTVLLMAASENNEREAKTGDDEHKKLKEKQADMLIRQRAALWNSHGYLERGVRLVKTYHAEAWRIRKTHRAFKKHVKSKIRAGDFDDFFGDWNLQNFDDGSSELEPDDALNAD